MRLEAETTIVTVAIKSGNTALTCVDSIGEHCSMITLSKQVFLQSVRAAEPGKLDVGVAKGLLHPKSQAKSN